MLSLFLTTSVIITTNSQLTKEKYYANWFGELISSTNIETNRIIDVILPGSHHAGMYKSAIEANNYMESDDVYFDNVIFWAGGNEAKLKWAYRQKGTLQDQLNAGSRFLDIRLEKKNNTIYAHHGLLGATLTDMLADIKAFLESPNFDGNDIIILSFNNFININADADVFNTAFNTALGSFMADTGDYVITDNSISQLLTAGANVIPFFDGTTLNDFVWGTSDTILTGNETISAEENDIVAGVLSGLTNAWDSSTTTGQINQIYYTLNVPGTSDQSKYSNLFASYLEYSASLAVTLSNTITNYPKLYFGNIIIVDFIQVSSVTDQVVTLNYNYLNCRDPIANWNGGTMDCSVETDLPRDYKTSDISTSCTGVGIDLQTDCKRSCGTCDWLTGVVGSQCTVDTDCTSDIYTDILGGDGVCFIRHSDWETFISAPSFCLAPFSFDTCGTISSDVCSNDLSTDTGCTDFCNADFQCTSGYCNSNMGVCLEITTPAPTSAPEATECYCPLVISEQAVDFRDDIEGFRPGDPDGEYAFVGGACSSPGECNDMLDENPYIKSLVGFIILPFIFSILMFIIYFCCCMCWCGCGNFWKKKCCRCCLGEPDESIGARWGPSIVMFSILIVILWACIEGISANQKMHDHVFSETEDSLRGEMLGLFDTIIDKFEGIGPEADWIVNNIKSILGSVDGIIQNVDGNTADDITKIYNTFNYLSFTYNDYSLNATVTTPFEINGSLSNYSVTLPCDYCNGLGAQIGGINDTFKSAVSIIQNMQSLLNGSTGLVDAEDAIDTAVGEFNKIINNFTNTIRTYRNDTALMLDDMEDYDKQREQAGTYFFILPILWIVMWIIGVILGILKKCSKLGECCFRCTWCQNMFIGATIMLIFSFFGIISVGWADFCVNLDRFEADPKGSQLGQTIAQFSGNYSGNDSMALNPVDIVNACWTGSDLLGVFDLKDTMNWDSFRENLTDVINIDITKEFTLDTLDSFITEINLLNTDEFQVEGDRLIDALNSVGIGRFNNGFGCVCTCGTTHGTDPGALFTRDKLRSGQCHNSTYNAPWDCWSDVTEWAGFPLSDPSINIQSCIGNFTAAYTYVQAEEKLIAATTQAIDDIKNETTKIISAYSGLFGTAVNIEKSVKNISCSIDPIFERFDSIIKNYSNCGFLGEAYGGFKNVGCVLLFTDMYWISCAMMIIAFFSLIIPCMGFMSQYSWHPAKQDDPDEDIGSQLVKRASQKALGTPLGKQLSARASDKFPRISNSLRDLQVGIDMANHMENMENEDNDDEMAEGDGGQAQPAPPQGTPPPDGDFGTTTNDGGGLGTTNANDGDMTTPNMNNDGLDESLDMPGNDDNDIGGGGDIEMPQIEASAPPDVDDMDDDNMDDSQGGDVL